MTTRAHFAIAASVLLTVAGVGQSAFAWELYHWKMHASFGHCAATLNVQRAALRWTIAGYTVRERRNAGQDETKPILFINGFSPHHTRPRPSTLRFGLVTCWLDGGVRRCENFRTEHRITYRIGNGDREEAWVGVGSSHGNIALHPQEAAPGHTPLPFTPAEIWPASQSSAWWDWPDELFATNDRQLLRLDAGGNTRPDLNGLVSPTSLLVELWNARSVMAQLQRCAQRYLDDGLLGDAPTGVGELPLGPNGRVLGIPVDPHGHVLDIPGGFDESLDGDVPTDGEWDWWVDEP